MRPDIEELRQFYGTRQGQLARRLINAQIRALWPDLAGQAVLGIGYPIPFLPVLDEAACTIAAMPAQQGVARWPTDTANRAVLVREDDLPLADGSIDRVLLVHALEAAADVRRLIREVWRVLADGGRLLVVVPNRAGLWGWSERTPFGYGQPYSKSQLDGLMTRHLFAPVAQGRALYLPPVRSSLVLRLGIPVERVGRRLAPNLAGVILLEAEKRIYLGRPELIRAKARRRRYVPVPEGVVAAREGFPGRLAARERRTVDRRLEV
jgi:SAM-dependent methyltransferase